MPSLLADIQHIFPDIYITIIIVIICYISNYVCSPFSNLDLRRLIVNLGLIIFGSFKWL